MSTRRNWLQVIHCNIFYVFTIPEVANLVLITLFNVIAVVKALGTSCNLTVLQYKVLLGLDFHVPLMTLLKFYSSHSYSRRLPALG